MSQEVKFNGLAINTYTDRSRNAIMLFRLPNGEGHSVRITLKEAIEFSKKLKPSSPTGLPGIMTTEWYE